MEGKQMNLRQQVLIERIRESRAELTQFEQDAILVRNVTGEIPAESRAAIQRGASIVEQLEVELAGESTSF
jgi:hypothetical protein